MAVDGLGTYDEGNIFARILRDEIPATRIHDDAYAIAFADQAPKAPTHVLVIPRGPYVSFADFSSRASDREIAGFWRAVGAVARMLGVEADGYRLLANTGRDAGQEVPHFHVHLFGGAPLGPMLTTGR